MEQGLLESGIELLNYVFPLIWVLKLAQQVNNQVICCPHLEISKRTLWPNLWQLRQWLLILIHLEVSK